MKVWRSAQVLMWIGLLGVILAVGRILIDPILSIISGATIGYRWGPAAIKTILLLGLYGFSLFLSYRWKVRPKIVGLLVLSSAWVVFRLGASLYNFLVFPFAVLLGITGLMCMFCSSAPERSQAS